MHTDKQAEYVMKSGFQPLVMLQPEQVLKLRTKLHELANLFTGVLMGGGVLCRALEGDRRAAYAESLCELGERGAVAIREVREVLLNSEAKSEMLGGEELYRDLEMSAKGGK